MMNFRKNRRNYYIRSNRAYTEDHILVKKIFLRNVPKHLSPEAVKAYFEIYGNVECLQLNDNIFNCKMRWGYVLYKYAEDATKALAKQNHFLRRCQFEVSAYHSWGQPDAKKIQTIDSNADIMRLSDDCLEVIYRYLPLRDQLNLAMTMMRYPPIYRSINFSRFKGMSLWKIRDFFKLFGADLRQFSGLDNSVQSSCEFIGEYCINLRIIHISHCALSPHHMCKMLKRLTDLEEVQLINCCLTDDCLLPLQSQYQLKKLDVSYNERLTGLHMKSLPDSIESLHFLYCSDVDFELIPEICKAFPHLKELSLMVATSDTDLFQQMVKDESCNFLESLTIWSNPSFDGQIPMEYLALLPKIKKLVLHHGPPSSRLLKWLVKHKSEQLNHLEIICHTSISSENLNLLCQLTSLRLLALPNNNELKKDAMKHLHKLQKLTQVHLERCHCLTKNDILALVQACPRLHVLHLECCKLITEELPNDLVQKLDDLLSDPRSERQIPIKLYFLAKTVNQLSVKYLNAKGQEIVQVVYNLSISC